LRIIRDTIPANGFDNGIRVRLTDKDEFAIKDGGYAIFENVITDSIVGPGVLVQVKNGAGGTLNIRKDSKKGDVISKCELPSAGDASKWIDVRCSNLPELKGVQDFYLTAENLGGEMLVGNIKFDEGVKDSTDAIRRIDTRDNRALRAGEMRPRNGYRDLKGRSFDKQIPYRVMF
jgi:arabinan endo-1,5-alpha-L-arabinosidase